MMRSLVHRARQQLPVVRHDEQGALEVAQRFFEHVPTESRSRWFVGSSSTRKLCCRSISFEQAEPIALSARKHPRRPVDEIRAEAECAQVGAHLLLVQRAVHAPDLVEERRRIADEFQFLIEVAEVDVGPQSHRAGIGGQFPRQDLEQRRLAGAVRADDADLVAAREIQVEVREQLAIPVRLAEPAPPAAPRCHRASRSAASA